MRLKNAVALAKRRGLKWVAADKDGSIWAYSKKPEIYLLDWIQGKGDDDLNYKEVGKYSGDKNWRDTLREVV